MKIDPQIHTELDVIHGVLTDSGWMPSPRVATALAEAVHINLRLLRAEKALLDIRRDLHG